jgi:hypothetical protein
MSVFYLRQEARRGAAGERGPAEFAEAALSDGEALRALSHELRDQLAAFHDGAVLPAAVRQGLLAEHRALPAELEALHLRAWRASSTPPGTSASGSRCGG